MVDYPETGDSIPQSDAEGTNSVDTQSRQREEAWQAYFQRPMTGNSEALIREIMSDQEVQPWAKIKAMDTLLAPHVHPDYKPFLNSIDADKYDSVDRIHEWVEYIGAEEAEYMAKKIPEYMESVKDAIDTEPSRTSPRSLALEEKLSDYYSVIPTVLRKIQTSNPEAAEKLFSLMIAIDPLNQNDEGRIRTGHVLATLGDHLLDEKWKRMMVNKIHKDIDASYGQEKQVALVKEYIKVFDLILGSIDRGVEPPFSKTFFEDEMQYLLEVGNQESGINIRHTLSALELLRDNPELAHQFARSQVMPVEELFWFIGKDDKYRPRDMVKIADMFPDDAELVQKIKELEADLDRRHEEQRAHMGQDEAILDRLKQP